MIGTKLATIALETDTVSSPAFLTFSSGTRDGGVPSGLVSVAVGKTIEIVSPLVSAVDSDAVVLPEDVTVSDTEASVEMVSLLELPTEETVTEGVFDADVSGSGEERISDRENVDGSNVGSVVDGLDEKVEPSGVPVIGGEVGVGTLATVVCKPAV